MSGYGNSEMYGKTTGCCDILLAMFCEIRLLILCQRLCQLLFDLGLRFAMCGTSFASDILLYLSENSHLPNLPKKLK